MLTVGLLAVVVYLYTVVAFNFFRKFYNKSEDGDMPDMKCDDMLTVSLILILCICYDNAITCMPTQNSVSLWGLLPTWILLISGAYYHGSVHRTANNVIIDQHNN